MARARKEPGGDESAREQEDVGNEELDKELGDEDFQFALKELLAAYEPILAEELERAQAPERLEQEAREHPPSCEDEVELGSAALRALLHRGGRAASAAAGGARAARLVRGVAVVPTGTSAAASSSAGSSAAGRGRSGPSTTTSTATGAASGR